MALTVENITVKSEAEIASDYLRTYRNSLIKRGIEKPNVSEGTEIFLRATALAQQAAVIAASIPVLGNSQMPDTALGDDLIRIAKLYKLGLRPAGPSAGSLVLSATVSTPIAIPSGSQLLDPSGLSYQVSVGGSYANGSSIPVSSIDTGAATNLAEGTVLRWTAPPAFVQPTALVASGGLTGGIDGEDIEGLRARLLERLASPPNGSNWPYLVGVAEATSTAVQKAFAYPAANGPSTMHVAVVRPPSATNRNRDVDATLLATTITPTIQGEMVEYAELVVTTVQNFPVNVAFGIAIPSSQKASGAGGGWLDANPFPVFASAGFSGVLAGTTTKSFNVPSDVAPVVGDTVCWLSSDDWILRMAKIVSFTGTGPDTITIDAPFVSVNGTPYQLGDYIFPGAESMSVYVQAVLDGFSKLGPGEKTNQAGLLPRALRRPLKIAAWPSDLNRTFLKNLTDAGEEVTDVDYLFRSATTPPVPTLITQGPFQIVPARIGIYPLPG